MKTRNLLASVTLALVALAQPSLSQASTVSWGSDTDSFLFNSSGIPMDNSFTFEIGTFGGNFVPLATNSADWFSNWKRLDQATASNGRFNPGAGWVTSNFTILDGSDPSTTTDVTTNSPFKDASKEWQVGDKAYVFAYNTQTISPATEWALISDPTWLLPPSESHSSITSDWLVNTATQVVMGGNGETFVGVRSVDPGIADLQTTVVPEPSSALLIGAVGMLGLLRRRRSE
jgi:hypothetical protein